MKKKLNNQEISFTRPMIISVLAFVAALGGYGGYVVLQQHGQYDAGFEENLHIVERVVDGDTLILDDKSVVRLLLIDAPEPESCFGPEAKKELQSLVLGKRVRLQKDTTATDSRNRLLRYVFVYSEDPRADNIFVNEEMLKNGFAKLFPQTKDRLFQELLINSAGSAKNNQKGLYKACTEVSDVVEQTDPKCNIKGNNSQYDIGKKYFFPGCANYPNVKMEKKNGDEWFCTEKEAQQAGYSKATNCPLSA